MMREPFKGLSRIRSLFIKLFVLRIVVIENALKRIMGSAIFLHSINPANTTEAEKTEPNDNSEEPVVPRDNSFSVEILEDVVEAKERKESGDRKPAEIWEGQES